MKALGISFALLLAAVPCLEAQVYTNFIRQRQQEVNGQEGVVWDMPVATIGESLSALAINPGGAHFELHTVNSVTAAGFLIRSVYVGAYIPAAHVTIRSEDPYDIIPRTRADRPFWVDVKVDGLIASVEAPIAAQKVKFLHHVQSYGAGGTGVGINPTQATMLPALSIESNGVHNFSYQINAVPGADRAKVRGEERFSVFSLEDYQAPESELASQKIQIWPVSDGTLSGISHNQDIRFKMPTVTAAGNDLYPGSDTYVQVYKGPSQLGTTGKRLTGGFINTDLAPRDKVLVFSDYDSELDEDGQWTMELLTKTPFGIDRLAYVTFDYDRTLEMNGSVNTIAD